MAKAIYTAPGDARLHYEVARLRVRVRELEAEVERLQAQVEAPATVDLDDSVLADLLDAPVPALA